MTISGRRVTRWPVGISTVTPRTIMGSSGAAAAASGDDLTSVEALAAIGIACRIASNTWALRSISVSGNGLNTVSNADGSAGNPTISLDIGTGATQVAAGNHAHSGVYEPVITAGTSAQYWRGDKTWQTLNQAAVAGLTTTDSPIFVTVKCSGLTTNYIPYHVSAAAGLANSPLSVSGGYVYCGSRLYLNGEGQVFNLTQAPTDPASGTTAVSIVTNPIYTATTPRAFYALTVNNRPIINTGVSNNSTQAGANYNVFRNYYQGGSDDSGTLTNLHGQRINYGHYDTNTSATPQTVSAYGLYIIPHIKTGAIGTMVDIAMAADSTGGSYTYRYGIRQLNAGWNYFGGNLGLGKDATGTPDGTNSLYVTLGTPPSKSHTNTFIMYGADISAGNAAPHFRTENGGIIKLYQQPHLADEKTDYTTGDLDTEAEIIAAINATNTKINSVLAALENTGQLAVA